MEYLISDSTLYAITITTNICFALLFIYNMVKKDTNYSLLSLSGCLCLAMAFVHYFTSYTAGLDKSGAEFYALIVNGHLISVILSSFTVMSVFVCHRILNVPFHPAVRYVFRAIFVSVLLNFALHIDIMVLGNRDTTWLFALYSYGENVITLYMFLSVLIARKWSEVFRYFPQVQSR